MTPSGLPVGGERHERAVEAAQQMYSEFVYTSLSDATEAPKAIIAAYFAELERLGVRLVDLGEVVEWCEDFHRRLGVFPAPEAIERRFGGGER